MVTGSELGSITLVLKVNCFISSLFFLDSGFDCSWVAEKHETILGDKGQCFGQFCWIVTLIGNFGECSCEKMINPSLYCFAWFGFIAKFGWWMKNIYC